MDVGAVRSRRRRGAMSQPSPTQAVNDKAMARAREEITRRTAEGEFGHPPNIDLRDRAMMEIFEQEAKNAREEELILKYKTFLRSRKWDARTTDLTAELESNTNKLYFELIDEIRKDTNGIRWRLGVHTLDAGRYNCRGRSGYDGEILIHLKDNLYLYLGNNTYVHDAIGLVEIDLEDLDDPLKYVNWNEDGKDE